ncbi:MAG: 5-bromo-4-chloroindolyl phosphate hydrolysis family protein, partial [Bacillota bacterium]|nr:5-bromo-4-chloroindolyl phosphate hydrolysis family protein [Bacillota bacterium]
MNSFISLFVRIAASLPTAVIVWLISFFAFNQTFLLSSAISIAGAGAVWLAISTYTKARFLKRNRLTRKEYRYIKANLDEAKQKI